MAEIEIRNFTADDMFPMFQIISKIGIKEFKQCFESEDVKKVVANMANSEEKDSDATTTTIGVQIALDIVSILMANIGKCKSDIYQFLSQVTGLTVKEIAALPMLTFTKLIVDVVKKEEFKDFFTEISGLLKSAI